MKIKLNNAMKKPQNQCIMDKMCPNLEPIQLHIKHPSPQPTPQHTIPTTPMFINKSRWLVGSTCVKRTLSSTYKLMVETTKKLSWTLIESIDQMHETTMVVEEKWSKTQ
jgi:hypothetical protein